jgi:hypothetical protein
MMDSQDDKTSSSAPNKRRRFNNQRGGSSGDDGEDDVISLYSDSSNDGGNLSSNASSTSPESANKMETTNLTGPQQQSSIQRKSEEATNSNEVLPNKSPSSIDQKSGAANNNNDNSTNNDTTGDDEEYCTTTTYRTVQVPPGITEGQLFHVLIKLPLLPDGRADDKIIGVTCPKGVKGGDTIIVVEPGSSPPLTPDQIAKINERRLLRGIDKENAKWVAISFWKIVWPLLVAEGWWCERESLYNFGSVTFYSPAAAKKKKSKEKQLQLNEQYFESIKGVLDFIKLLPVRKSLVDMCFADAQKRKMKSVQLAQKALATKRSYIAFDRWKYPTGMEALKHSRVGSHYQAQNLPEVWAYSRSKSYSDGCTTLEPIGNLKEHDDSSVKSTWLEWAKDDAFANEFHCKLLEAKKQFRLLAASINKPMGFCLWYYYHKYKTSDYYVILKKLLRDNNNNESGEHLDECVICDDGGGESDVLVT